MTSRGAPLADASCPSGGAADDGWAAVAAAPSATWRIESPASRAATLTLAGARARVRRVVLAQVRTADSVAIYRGDEIMAVAMFARHGWRRLEMALAISRAAAPHMRRLVRIAQLTLPSIAQDRIVVIRVHPANSAGARMAMLTGFRPARLRQPGFWILEGAHGGVFRRGREEGGGRGEGAGRGVE